jgi:MFS family permease
VTATWPGVARTDLALLRQRRFRLLFSCRTLSMFGNAFGPIALAFGVLALPGATSATLAVVVAAYAVPQLGLMLAGGVIGDRFPRYRVLMAAETLSGAAFAGMAAMLLTGFAPVPLLTGCAVVAGGASALLLPNLTGIIPEVVERSALQPANALLRLGGNTANIAGLLMAGMVVAFVGPGFALAFDAATYLVAAMLLAGLRAPAVAAAVSRRTRSVWGDLRDGFREFAGRQWLWSVVVSAAFVNAGSAATFGVLGPVLADEQLGGALPWSVVLAGYSGGMLLSVVVALRIRPARPLRTAVLLTPLLAAPMIALSATGSLASLGAVVPLVVVTAAAVCAGGALNLFSVLWETTLQREVATDRLSRVASCNYMVALSLKPVGIYLAGRAAADLGGESAVLLLGGVLLVAGLAPLLSLQVRQLTDEERA